MSTKLKLKQWEIALLEWNLKNLSEESVYASSARKWTSSGLGPEAALESQRYWGRKKLAAERRRIQQRLAYLKRHLYIERIKEGERLLYTLTSKGKFEVLRLQFILHMQKERKKSWSRRFYMAVFDIPEHKKKFRDFFRTLLKKNGFVMLQRSVWMTRYNPRPAIDALLKHLQLTRYFELMEIHCDKCSSHLQRRIR